MIEQSHRKFATIFALLILCTTPSLTAYHLAFATSSTGIMIPLYSYPGSYWTQVIQAKNAHPSVPIVVIINPNNGPGSSIDQNYVSGIQQMQAAGITVLGYTYTHYGARSASSIEADIDSYNSWYHVNGILFDEMANTPGYESYYSSLSSYVHSHGMSMTAGNPGTSTLSSYVGTVDVLHIYENPGLPSISTVASNTFNGAYPKSNFAIIAFGVSSLPSQSTITAYSNDVAWMYITDDVLPNPYDTVPSYLGTEVAMLDTGSGGTTTTAPSAPTGLSATATSSSQINLSWTAPSSNGGSAITGYEIDRSANAGSTWSTVVSNTGSTSTTYSDTGLAASTAYTYRVSAINAVGTSSPSSTASATTLASVSPPPTGNTFSLTVNSDNLAGSQFSGMWVELHASNGTILATGYTPVTFSVSSGVQYVVYAANYQSNIFNHWQDGTTNSSFTITPTQNTTLTAYYSTAATITVKSVDLSGNAFSGMWTVIKSGGTTVATGYTPFHYNAQSGNTYTVTVANYQNYVFSHWSDGSTNPTRTITPTQNITLVAYYNS